LISPIKLDQLDGADYSLYDISDVAGFIHYRCIFSQLEFIQGSRFSGGKADLPNM